MSTQTPLQRQWSELIAECSATGLSIAEFCRQKGIKSELFYAWKYRLKKKQADHPTTLSGSGAFLPLLVHQNAQPATVTVVVNQVEIHYQVDTDDQLFLKVVQLLREAA